jgi:hypothetical protein
MKDKKHIETLSKSLKELGIDWIMATRSERSWRACVRLDIEGIQVAGYADAKTVALALERAVDRAREAYDAVRNGATPSEGGDVDEGIEPKERR